VTNKLSGAPIALCLSFPRELFAREAGEFMEVQAALSARQAAELGSVLLQLSGAAEVRESERAEITSLSKPAPRLDAAKLN